MSEEKSNQQVNRQYNQQHDQQQRGQQQQYNTQQHNQKQRRQQQPSQQQNNADDASVPLVEGEQLLVDARPAWSAYSLYFIIAGIILLAGLVAGDEAFFGGAIAAGLILGYVWYQRNKVRYVITDRRLMIIQGMSSKTTNETWMVDVRHLRTGASVIERLLGHGHISVSTRIASSGLGRFTGMTFGGIDDYEEIAQIIRQRQNEAKMKQRP